MYTNKLCPKKTIRLYLSNEVYCPNPKIEANYCIYCGFLEHEIKLDTEVKKLKRCLIDKLTN